MFKNLIIFSVIGAVIGWAIGMLLNYIWAVYDNHRWKRAFKRQEVRIEKGFFPVQK